MSGPWVLETQNAGWVEMITRKLCQVGEEGLIIYGYKFRPKLEEAYASGNLRQAHNTDENTDTRRLTGIA